MGYCSKVLIKAQPEAAKMFENVFSDNICPDNTFINACGDKAYLWDWTKWYAEFPEIEAIESIRHRLGSEDAICEKDGYGFVFWRQGENYEDVETDINQAGINADFYTGDDLDGFQPYSPNATIWTAGCVVNGRYLTAKEISEIQRLMDVQEGKDIWARFDSTDLNDDQYEEIAKGMRNALVEYSDCDYHALATEVFDSVLQQKV